MALIVFDTAGAREMARELARERGLDLSPLWLRKRAARPLRGGTEVRAGALAGGPFPCVRGKPALVGAAPDVAEVAREREQNPLFRGVGMSSVPIFYEDDERPLFEGPGGPAGDPVWRSSPEGRAAAKIVSEKAERRGLYSLLTFLLGFVALLDLLAWLWPPAPSLATRLGCVWLVLARSGAAVPAARWLRHRYHRGLSSATRPGPRKPGCGGRWPTRRRKGGGGR